MIVFDLATFLPGNVGEARSDGIKFQSSLRPFDALTLHGSYAYTRTEDCSTGKQLPRRPRNSGAIGVSYRSHAFDVLASGTFVGKRLDAVGNPTLEYLNSSYSIFDMAFTYHLDDSHELFCKVKNLTDERYDEVAGYPAPGLRFMAGTKMDFWPGRIGDASREGFDHPGGHGRRGSANSGVKPSMKHGVKHGVPGFPNPHVI